MLLSVPSWRKIFPVSERHTLPWGDGVVLNAKGVSVAYYIYGRRDEKAIFLSYEALLLRIVLT